MQHRKLLGLLLLLLLVAKIQAQQSELRVPAGSGYVEFTFDSRKVSREDLERWIKLSLLVAAENGNYVPERLEDCSADDPRYVNCGQRDQPVYIHNAQLNLEKIRARIDKLQPDRFPPELSGVVSYLRQVQLFFLCRETHRLAFLTTGSASELEVTCEDVDPKTSCAPALQKIRSATNQVEAARLAKFEWGNCMWFAFAKQFGEYPKGAWDSFRSAFGIGEREINTED